MQAKELLGKNWLLIIAHPDDESYLFAGSIYKNWQQGGSCVIACATHGGRGSGHVSGKISNSDLAGIRKKELLKASRVLKAKKVFLHDIPDCECHLHKKIYLRFCERVAKKLKPDLVVSFNEDGFTGHKDHIAAFQVAKKISELHGIPLFVITMPPGLRPYAKKLFGNRQKRGLYNAVKEYALPQVSIRINSLIKKKALLCHASQLDRGKILPDFPKHAVRQLFSNEFFVKI